MLNEAGPIKAATRTAAAPHCRFCNTPLTRDVVNLGAQPSANFYIHPERVNEPEPTWPLHVRVCESCFLVQIESLHTTEALFGDYAYFSSYADSWLRHAEAYAGQMISRFGLGPQSQVLEVASNDGYLLQYFKREGVPVLGIDPARNVAQVAINKGIPTLVGRFGREIGEQLRSEGRQGDLIAANNVLAHVPDINDFVAGFAPALKPGGVLTVEFPHLLNLIAENQFDTIYHEHFSYLSLTAVDRIFTAHGLRIFDIDQLPTHGGSLRIYAELASGKRTVSARVGQIHGMEAAAGLLKPETYSAFAERCAWLKRRLLSLLIRLKDEGRSVAAYGAPAKGNTLLNYCGARTDLIDFTVDRSPHKQGLLLPGTRIPILAPDHLRTAKPDYLLILPWNLRDEIMENCSYIRSWGGRFIVPIPQPQILP
jgi:SAM-dependent methyltransferase